MDKKQERLPMNITRKNKTIVLVAVLMMALATVSFIGITMLNDDTEASDTGEWDGITDVNLGDTAHVTVTLEVSSAVTIYG